MKKSKKKVYLTFEKLERMAKKKGVPVFAVLDLIIQQTLNQ